MSFFDRMDSQRIAQLRLTFSDAPVSTEQSLIRTYLENHPCCYAGIADVWMPASPLAAGEPRPWIVSYDGDEENGRFCAAVALAALSSVTSLPVAAHVSGTPLSAPAKLMTAADPLVAQVSAEIADLKRLGLWGRHA
ncbi:hypothetical protein [Paracoccus cavernae]|uniref:hypothetical protein n=1 Tax=Paracoccus cavernae TaxID=1571207 RepID=UPI00363FAA33